MGRGLSKVEVRGVSNTGIERDNRGHRGMGKSLLHRKGPHASLTWAMSSLLLLHRSMTRRSRVAIAFHCGGSEGMRTAVGQERYGWRIAGAIEKALSGSIRLCQSYAMYLIVQHPT